MKKQIVFLILFVVTTYISAQKSDNLNAIFFQSGMINNGYNIEGGFEKKFGNKQSNSIAASLNYHSTKQTVNYLLINETSTYVDISYKRYLFKNYHPNFSPYFGAGGIFGIQHIPETESGIYHISSQNSSIYGINSNIGIEYTFNKISLFGEGKYIFTGDHYLKINLGLKYNFK